MFLDEYKFFLLCDEKKSVFVRYYNQGTYLISDLSSRMLVRRLHLPTPSDERERAIAERLSEEAELHGIEVFFDAEEYLLQYDGNP